MYPKFDNEQYILEVSVYQNEYNFFIWLLFTFTMLVDSLKYKINFQVFQYYQNFLSQLKMAVICQECGNSFENLKFLYS